MSKKEGLYIKSQYNLKILPYDTHTGITFDIKKGDESFLKEKIKKQKPSFITNFIYSNDPSGVVRTKDDPMQKCYIDENY